MNLYVPNDMFVDPEGISLTYEAYFQELNPDGSVKD